MEADAKAAARVEREALEAQAEAVELLKVREEAKVAMERVMTVELHDGEEVMKGWRERRAALARRRASG